MVRRSLYGISSARVSLFAALHTLAPAVDASVCTDPKTISFTIPSPGKEITANEEPGAAGLRHLFISAQQMFGEAVVSATGLPKEFKQTHYSKMDAYTVATLLTDSGSLYGLVVICLALTVVFPVVGASVLLMRFLCGWCGGDVTTPDKPQTPEEVTWRTQCSLAFWVPVVFMTVMVFGALVTLGHASMALDSASKQASFIRRTLPTVLVKPIDDIGVITVTNLDEFTRALRSRANACANEAVAVTDDVLKKDVLLKFAGTISQRLAQINALIDKVESAAGSQALKEVRRHATEASTSLRTAEQDCTGCSVRITQLLKQAKQGLDTFVTVSEIVLPQKVTELKTKLQQVNVSGQLAQIPTTQRVKKEVDKVIKELETKMNELRENLKGKIQNLNASVQNQEARAETSLASWERTPADVRSHVGKYELVLAVISIMLAAITGLYIFGNQCLMWQAPTGFLSLTTASWALFASVLLFLINFPSLMPVSTLSMGLATVVDRRVCLPAKDIGSPASRPLAEFLSRQLSEEGASEVSKHFKVARALALSHRAAGQNQDESSFDRRNPVATSANSAVRKRTSASAAKHPGTRAKPARSPTPATRNRRAKTQHRRRRYRKTRRQGGVDGQTITDLTAVLRKRLTPGVLHGVMQRLSRCPKEHLSLFKLMGKELMVDLARNIVGGDSPWLGLVDDTVGAPKFEALDNFSSLGKIPPMDASMKAKLGEFTSPLMDQDLFKLIADASKAAKQGFGVLGRIKSGLEQLNTQRTPAAASVRAAISSLGEALKLKTAWDAQMDAITEASDELGKAVMVEGKRLDVYVKELMDQWDALVSQRGDIADKIQETARKAKNAFEADITQYFEHAKTQVRDHVGDCQPLYVLYITTVNTACDEGLSPFAAFWFCVWWFQVVGVPAWVGALILSTCYARSAAQEGKEEDSVVERKRII